MPGYATLGLTARYPLDDQLTLELKGSNLLDRQYETAAGYRQPGRGLMATASYTF